MADKAKEYWLVRHMNRCRRGKYTSPSHETNRPCPECGEKRTEELIRLRAGFYECRTCGHTFMKEDSQED